ncbi:DNA polymerase III subunit gamma/tau [Lujinxingia sediminis]|uniref:DNA polymerase III subunit gamma/tau n=1 Tax=Lujinxingia sediminis TaxID=2480984 RepID=UPI0013E32094|nr:DNA polymerase III subunit gamma/tau [Lujinxingia sediminis]
MSYKVLARKWRPEHFEQVVGQGHVARTLKNAIEQDRVHHAYLFCGARGVGKTSTARILAKALNCEQGPTATPCYQCASCQEISKGQSVDVFEIDGASNRGINEIRELREGVRYAPSRDRNKIYIIDEVHMLTTEAFNALLKTLEEPPDHARFIFATTEPQKIPVTILSRCQRFDFKRIGQNDIVEHLEHLCREEGIDAERAALQIVARQAAGGMRDALSLLDQIISFSGKSIKESEIAEVLGVANRRHLFDLSEAVLTHDAERALVVVDEVNRYGYDMQQFASELVTHFRDLMVTSVVQDPELVTELTESELQVARQQIAGQPQELLHRCFSVMVEGAQKMHRSPYPRLIFEMTLVRLAALEPMVGLDLLVDRLGLLEEALSDDIGGEIAWPERPAPPVVAARVASAAPVEKKTLSEVAPATGGHVEVTGGHVEVTGGHVEVTGGHAEVTEGEVTGGHVEVTGGHVEVTEGEVTGGHVEVTEGQATEGQVSATEGQVTEGHVEVTESEATGGHVEAIEGHAEVTEGHVEVTERHVEETEGQVTEGHAEVTEGHVEVTERHVEVTEGQVTEGHVEVTEGHVEVTEGQVSATEGQVTGGHAPATEGQVTEGHVEATEGHVEVTEGQVTEGHVEATEGHAEVTEGHAPATEGEVTEGYVEVTEGEVTEGQVSVTGGQVEVESQVEVEPEPKPELELKPEHDVAVAAPPKPRIPERLTKVDVDALEVPDTAPLKTPEQRWKAVVEFVRQSNAPVAAACEYAYVQRFDEGEVRLNFTEAFADIAQEDARKRTIEDAVVRIFGEGWRVVVEKIDEEAARGVTNLAEEREEDIRRRRAELVEEVRTDPVVAEAQKLFGAEDVRVSVKLFDE